MLARRFDLDESNALSKIKSPKVMAKFLVEFCFYI